MQFEKGCSWEPFMQLLFKITLDRAGLMPNSLTQLVLDPHSMLREPIDYYSLDFVVESINPNYEYENIILLSYPKYLLMTSI